MGPTPYIRSAVHRTVAMRRTTPLLSTPLHSTLHYTLCNYQFLQLATFDATRHVSSTAEQFTKTKLNGNFPVGYEAI